MNNAAAADAAPGRRVLLAGCGDLGAEVGRRLHGRGDLVTGLRRRPERHRAGFPVLGIDLADPGDALLPPADTVVVALTADSRSAQGYEAAYRRTLQGLRRMLPGQEPDLLFVSSTSVLGTREGQIVTEATVPEPASATAEVLLAAEQDARSLFRSVTVLRPAGIYGPGRTRTIERVRRGEPVDHGLITNRIHRDDLAALIGRLVHLPEGPELLHASDCSPAPQGEVAEFIAGRLGVPVPPDAGDGRSRGKTIDASALHGLLGGQPLTYPSYREGWAAVLAAL